jgi:hypothetical protein
MDKSSGLRYALEEDAALSGGVIRWLGGRQTAFHLTNLNSL